MDELRKERLAINESLYRNVNEGIRAGQPDPGQTLAVRCECGALGCNRLMDVPYAVYESVRAHPRRFMLLSGHDVPEVEVVVERHGTFDIVEKLGETGDIADATDPRDR
ncbi:MAG TPA: hypothetical protein VE526_02640 [Solirubrobacteraceae bacterium]|jgi:hypothetical protein|nr:hypothetical protein [Solirubrobacteraceae bacterium]